MPVTTPSPELVDQLSRLGIPEGRYSLRPLDGLRRLIARRMVDSRRTAPHFSVSMDIETDQLTACRKALNAGSEVRVTINDLLIKAAAIALAECPAINCSFTEQGAIIHDHADIAFAVAMDGGLVTPIIREAETKSVAAISAETRELATRGRAKRLRPEEYSGGSFTISNLGMFGVRAFDAIINQPQAAILSIGASEKAYRFDGDAPRVASVMTATLTSDHRVIDGAAAAAWLNAFKHTVEAPEWAGD